MADARWAVEEARLWGKVMYVTVPRPPGLKAKNRKVRAKAREKWDKDTKRIHAETWKALAEFLSH